MTAPLVPPTDAELRWAYRVSRLAEQGISFDQAKATACLRASLELGVAIQRRRRARAARNTGAGIERSHPDYSSTHSSNV